MKAIKFMGLFLVIASMTSCQKENIDTTYNSDPSAVKLTATVGSPFTRSNPLGDGAASTGFNAGDRIAVTAQGQEEIIYTLAPDGTTWTPEAGKYHKWTTETMSFTAYYPARYISTENGDNNASLTTFNLPQYQNRSTGNDADIARADYMTFSGTLTKGTNGAASIALERQMARVRVVIASVGNEIDANDATFHISIFTQHTAIPANNDYHVVYPANGSLIRVGDVSTGLVIPSGAHNNRSFIQVKVFPHGQSGDWSGEYLLETLGIPAMEAGKSYTYNLKVGKEKIELENVTVADWNTGDVIPGGEAELINPQIGFYYFEDGTYSSDPSAGKPIGIVFEVNPDGKTGKIVGLTEGTAKKWGAYGTTETAGGITSTTDGATATKNLITARNGDVNFATDYSAFHWVYTTANESNLDGRWYIPAKEELKALYGKYTGDTNNDNSVKTAVNVSLNSVNGAAVLSDAAYWSSTENDGNGAWYVDFSDGYATGASKRYDLISVRVVSAF